MLYLHITCIKSSLHVLWLEEGLEKEKLGKREESRLLTLLLPLPFLQQNPGLNYQSFVAAALLISEPRKRKYGAKQNRESWLPALPF